MRWLSTSWSLANTSSDTLGCTPHPLFCIPCRRQRGAGCRLPGPFPSSLESFTCTCNPILNSSGRDTQNSLFCNSCRRQRDAGHRLSAQDPAVPAGHRLQKCGGGTAALRLPGGAPCLQPEGQGHRFVPPGFRVEGEPSLERLALARISRLGITCQGICLQQVPHVHLALILATKHSNPNRTPHQRFPLMPSVPTPKSCTTSTHTSAHTVPRHDQKGL